MTLDEALKEAIRLKGNDVLSSSTLIPLLDDLGAFKETKAGRMVLKVILRDGYMQEIVSTTETNLRRLIFTIVHNTGFQNVLVEDVVHALRIALNQPIVLSSIDETKDEKCLCNTLTQSENKENKEFRTTANQTNPQIIPSNNKFLGTNFGTTISQFIHDLCKKGFTKKGNQGDSYLLAGCFAGKNCKLNLCYAPYSLYVYRVCIRSKSAYKFQEILNIFQCFKDLYHSKYGEPKTTSVANRFEYHLGCGLSIDCSIEIEQSTSPKWFVQLSYTDVEVLQGAARELKRRKDELVKVDTDKELQRQQEDFNRRIKNLHDI